MGIEGLEASLSMDSASVYKDESSALRTAVCTAAGLPEGEPYKALEALSAKDPKLLRSLLETHSDFTTQVSGPTACLSAARCSPLAPSTHAHAITKPFGLK